MGDNISVAPFKQTNKGSGWKIHHGLAPLRVERSDCDLASHIIDPVPHRNLEWGLVLAFAGSQLRDRVTVMPWRSLSVLLEWNVSSEQISYRKPGVFPAENKRSKEIIEEMRRILP